MDESCSEDRDECGPAWLAEDLYRFGHAIRSVSAGLSGRKRRD